MHVMSEPKLSLEVSLLVTTKQPVVVAHFSAYRNERESSVFRKF